MDERTRAEPLLEWASTERGIYNEELATLGNLVKVANGSVYDAHVLRYVFDRGGRHRPVELPYAQMAGSPWINCSEKTVARSVLFWEEMDILDIERDRGRQLPNLGRLRWSSVLQRLLGGSSSVSATPLPSGARPDASDGQAERTGGLCVPMGGQPVHMGGLSVRMGGLCVPVGGQAVHPPHQCLRSPIRVLARARGLSVSVSVVTVDDDDRNIQRAVPFAEIQALAEEARLPIWPARWPRDAKVREMFTAAAVLGLTVLSRGWVLAATYAAKHSAKPITSPSRFWLGVLRNGLMQTEGFPPFADRDQLATYFGQLMHAAQASALEVIACYGEEELVPVGAPSPGDRTTADTKQEFLARLGKLKEAST